MHTHIIKKFYYKYEQRTVNKIIRRRVESKCNTRGQQTIIIIYFLYDYQKQLHSD